MKIAAEVCDFYTELKYQSSPPLFMVKALENYK